ncbi:MAG: DUF302 domain-containing protein [Elusimicrobia bacterium]|nr:DUF302 domain-containing protein [Elusimicrobiota bacterium]
MLHIIESPKPVREVEKDFSTAAQRHKFGVLGVHDLRRKMNDKGLPFERDCLVVEVCNPQQAHQVLSADMAISTALPCRVSIYTENGRTKLATIKPTALLAMFKDAQLAAVAAEVERELFSAMSEAA